jgi:hypothetical protein
MMNATAATRVLPLLAAVALCAGSSTQSTRRAALVPEVAPPMRSGAPMESMGEVSANLPGALSASDPEASAGEEPGLELPHWQLGAAGRLRVRDNLDIGLVYEQRGPRARAPSPLTSPRSTAATRSATASASCSRRS